jgi:hypothetical protein
MSSIISEFPLNLTGAGAPAATQDMDGKITALISHQRKI